VFEFCAVVLSPVVLALLAAIQLKLEATFAVNEIFSVFPLQMVAVFALVMDGVGSTVTLKVCDVPAQVPALDVGVTV
jgi:hypothetical protein